MLRGKKSAVCVTWIFRVGFKGANTDNSKCTDSVQLVKSIGIDENHTVKAKTTIEFTEELCALCGELKTGYRNCQRCGKPVCDKCAKTESKGRYCPKCFKEMRSLLKLI